VKLDRLRLSATIREISGTIWAGRVTERLSSAEIAATSLALMPASASTAE
jgi:hypothetical protein